ncbi:ABC transporter substrate-binding protein [Pseudochelatococcus sp. B33]
MRNLSGLLPVLCTAFIGFLAPQALASDPGIIEEAKKEGKLVLYTGADRRAAQSLVDAFQLKYPFISTEMVRASSSKLATRIDAEIEANRVGADVFEFSTLYLTESLMKRGEILQYDSPEYAAYQDPYVEPGYWAATGVANIIIMFNSQLVEPADHPKSWWDLTKPYWRNKLAIDNLEVSGTGYNWLVAMVDDERFGWKFIEELGKNKPALERGHAGIAQKVAAGEYAGAIEMSDFHLKNVRDSAAGAPVQGVWPVEGVPSEPWTMGILKRAAHPNAAKLFLDFALSKEGQTNLVNVTGWGSARADAPAPDFEEALSAADIKPIRTNKSADEALKVRDEYVRKWKELWGIR